MATGQRNFPKKWISEFMTMTENKIIEKAEVSLLLDIFAVGIVCVSGYSELIAKEEIFPNRFDIFPQALNLLSSLANFADIIGNIFEFIYFVIENNSTEYWKKTFRKSILFSKNHSHFNKPKTWHKTLQTAIRCE